MDIHLAMRLYLFPQIPIEASVGGYWSHQRVAGGDEVIE